MVAEVNGSGGFAAYGLLSSWCGKHTAGIVRYVLRSSGIVQDEGVCAATQLLRRVGQREAH